MNICAYNVQTNLSEATIMELEELKQITWNIIGMSEISCHEDGQIILKSRNVLDLKRRNHQLKKYVL